MTDVLDDLLDAWSIHNEINLFILDWIPARGLEAALKQSGVRPPEEVSYGTWAYWGGYPLKKPTT